MDRWKNRGIAAFVVLCFTGSLLGSLPGFYPLVWLAESLGFRQHWEMFRTPIPTERWLTVSFHESGAWRPAFLPMAPFAERIAGSTFQERGAFRLAAFFSLDPAGPDPELISHERVFFYQQLADHYCHHHAAVTRVKIGVVERPVGAKGPPSGERALYDQACSRT